MEITRRNFLKLGGLIGAGAAVPEAVKARALAPEAPALRPLASDEPRPALCKLCPALCMVEVRVVDGKPVGVAGKAGHPVSQGALCPKGAALLQELYHPDRLRHPLRRAGPRGADRWERISWDEALDLVGSRLSALVSTKRQDRLAMVAAPIRDIRHDLQRRLARALGTTSFWEWDWPLAQGPRDAFRLMHGSEEGLFYDLSNASHVVSFGWDWLQAFSSPLEAQRAYARLRRGRVERRTRMVQIEPRLSITAAKADEWIKVRPGTEGVLALGVAHRLLADELYDAAFVSRWTSGFERFRELVLGSYGPGRVAAQTGVAAATVARLAREMASIKPTLAITRRGSEFDQVAVHGLNALLGSIGVRRGVLWSEADRHGLSLPGEPGAAPRSAAAPASAQGLPEALASGAAEVEVLWLERVNPAFLAPQPSVWRAALEQVPFVLCFSSFMDETSLLADLVLPPHASLEAWQYGFSRTLEGDGVVSFAPPVVAPLHDTGDHGDFVLALARRLGLSASFPWAGFVDALADAAGRSGVASQMKTGGWAARPAGRERPQAAISRASGRLDFAAERLAAPPEPAAAGEFDLHLFVPLAYSFGEGAHLPYLHSIAGLSVAEEWTTWVEIHPHAAHRLGIADGEAVWVESQAGRVRAKARHFPGLEEGTVAMPLGLGHTAMGRYAAGVGSNPAELVLRRVDGRGLPDWQGVKVRVYAV